MTWLAIRHGLENGIRVLIHENTENGTMRPKLYSQGWDVDSTSWYLDTRTFAAWHNCDMRGIDLQAYTIRDSWKQAIDQIRCRCRAGQGITDINAKHWSTDESKTWPFPSSTNIWPMVTPRSFLRSNFRRRLLDIMLANCSNTSHWFETPLLHL